MNPEDAQENDVRHHYQPVDAEEDDEENQDYEDTKARDTMDDDQESLPLSIDDISSSTTSQVKLRIDLTYVWNIYTIAYIVYNHSFCGALCRSREEDGCQLMYLTCSPCYVASFI